MVWTRRPCSAASAAARSGRDPAAGVVAVGQEDEHLVLRVRRLEEPDAQADRVADHRVRAGHAGPGLVEKGAAGAEVARERRLEVGPVSEDDEAQPVALAARDEVLEHELHRLEPVEALPVGRHEVPRLHGLREIDREQQVARGVGLVQRRLHPLRPRQGEHDEGPGERGDEPLQDRPPEHRRPSSGGLAGGRGHLREERDAHRLGALAVGGQQPPDEERQRQGEQGQG